MNGSNANVHENQLTRRAPTETKMDVLTYAKAKMLRISEHYLKGALTKTESNSSRRQPIVHSNVVLTTKLCQK